MMLELYGTGRVTGKNEEKSLFSTRYVVAFEANVDGQRVTGTKKVDFDEYCGIGIGNEINIKLFSRDCITATPSRVEAGLESLFSAFVHPSLRMDL